MFGVVKFRTSYNIESLFLLHGLGITHCNNDQGLGNLHPTWYVSTLFWVLLFFQYIYNNFNKKAVNLFIAIAIILGYGLITQEQNGALGGKIAVTYYGIFNIGILRGISGIGIGYFIANIYQEAKAKGGFTITNSNYKIILSLIQISCLCTILYSLFVMNYFRKNDVFFILLFCIVFINFIFSNDYISQILNNKYLGCLGTYSYSIYVMHAFILDVFKNNVFTKRHLSYLNSNNNAEILFWLSVLACILIGILTYHLVEKTTYKKLKTELNK